MLMLDGLKNLRTPGNKDGFLFLLENVIADKMLSYEDVKILCGHAPGECHILLPEMIQYCSAFGWIRTENNAISVDSDVINLNGDDNALNGQLIQSTLKVLFELGCFRPGMFSFDTTSHRIIFHNELFPLHYSAIRNTLIDMGFFEVIRSIQGTTFLVAEAFEKALSKVCKQEKRKITLEQLKKKLESDAEIGEKAEKFVLAFERERIGAPLSENIRIISYIDVTAGYDIASYESTASCEHDRFIEVKAVSHDMDFFWSRNEYEIAKLKGNSYYIYLVDIRAMGKNGYIQTIINNPAEIIMESSEWMVEPQSYHIRRINNASR